MKSLILSLSVLVSLQAFAVEGTLGNYVTDAEMFEITSQVRPKRANIDGVAIRLDTRNAIQCIKIRNFIRRNNIAVNRSLLDDLCQRRSNSPYKDLVVFQTEENSQLLEFIKSGLNIGMTAYQSNSAEKIERERRLEDAAKSESFLLSPLFAAILSESVTHLRNHIQDNRGRLGNSHFLGSAIMVITNPAESVANTFNNIAKYKFIKSAKSQWLLRDYTDELTDGRPVHAGAYTNLNALEFRMVFKYN